MKKIIVLVMFFSFAGCKRETSSINKVICECLNIVKMSTEGNSVSGNKLDHSVFFLEKLTKIKGEKAGGDVIINTPNKKNYVDWTKWFNEYGITCK